MRDAQVGRQLDIALVGVQLALQQREQAGLARAVGADQPDALAGIEEKVSALEQRLRAARERDLGKADQARDSIAWLAGPDLLPALLLLLEDGDDVAPLEARQQERQPAERRMAKRDDRAAGDLVQLATVARGVERLHPLQLRRLLRDPRPHPPPGLRQPRHQPRAAVG